MMWGEFPIVLDGDSPQIRIYDLNGDLLDYDLNSSYLNFGTLPRGYVTHQDIYVTEALGLPMYSAYLEGFECENQAGEPEETYEVLSAQIGDDIGSDTWTDFPIYLGTIAKGSYTRVRVRYSPPADAPLGLVIFGIRVRGQ